MMVMENIHFHSIYLAFVPDEEELKMASLLNIRLGNTDVFKVNRGKKKSKQSVLYLLQSMFFTNNTWYVTSDWEYLYFYSHSPPPPFRWEASCSPSHRIIPGKKFAVARLHLGGERQRNTVTFGRKNPFICRKFEVLNAVQFKVLHSKIKIQLSKNTTHRPWTGLKH